MHALATYTPEMEYAEELMQQDYAWIPSITYQEGQKPQELQRLCKTYSALPADDYSTGSRYRAYANFSWDPSTKKLSKKEHSVYFQSKAYNYVDGDKPRMFSEISSTYLNSPILSTILHKDLFIARKTNLINFKQSVQVGLHQIRYLANAHAPAYSSPVWLHRDDEEVVFIHLFYRSANAIGGDLLIAEDQTKIIDAICLKNPLETLVVSKRCLHAATPLGTSNGQEAIRDILLVTFMPRTEEA